MPKILLNSTTIFRTEAETFLSSSNMSWGSAQSLLPSQVPISPGTNHQRGELPRPASFG